MVGVVKEVPSFGIIESVQNNKYILHAMKDNVAPTGVLICLQWYGRSVILWVGHSSCDCKISSVGTSSGLSLNTSGLVLGGMESTLFVAPFLICLIYNPCLLIYIVAPGVSSSIRISAENIYQYPILIISNGLINE